MVIKEIYTGIGGGIQTPTLLLIHAMGERIVVEKSFKLKNRTIDKGIYHAHDWLVLLGLSAHFLQNPDGSFIKQAPTNKICYHAKGFNSNSVGIEVLVEGEYTYETFKEKIKTDWVTQSQYDTLVDLSNDIIDYWNIKEVKRHSDVSPERKVDPGSGFDWEWYYNQLAL